MQPNADGTYATAEILKVNDDVPVVLDGIEAGRLPLRELLTPPDAQG